MPKLQPVSPLRPIRSQEAGFTMIELIMVIVILGILAAVALPRFYDLQTDARVAKMQAALGAVKSASAIAHSAFLVKGTNPASITMEGTVINLVNGYPDVVAGATAATSGIALAAGGLTDYDLTTTAATATVLTIVADAAHADCKVTYTEAVAGAAPVISAAPAATDCD